MKPLLFVLFLLPYFVFANEEVSLSGLIDSQNIYTDDILETDEVGSLDLLESYNVKLEQEFVNNIVYEDTKEESRYQNQADNDAKNNSCKQGKKEKIVCANVMCSFGRVAGGGWSDECKEWKIKLRILQVKLGPFKKLPRCKQRDQNCNKAGTASSDGADEGFCNNIEDLEERHTCLLALEVEEKDAAADYIVRNGVDEVALEQIAFDETESSELANNYLIASVDPRFARDEELFEPYTYNRDGGVSNIDFIPIEYLNTYMVNRESDPGSVRYVKNRLIKSGIMRLECANVTFVEFYNCNSFPDLPQKCWSAPNNESIAECVR